MILGQEPITRRRYGTATWGADGKPSFAAPTDSTIQASVQPANGRDLQILSEGLRGRETIKVYTTSDLVVAEVDGARSDELVVDGLVFQVHSVGRQRAVLPHYKALAVRVQEASP